MNATRGVMAVKRVAHMFNPVAMPKPDAVATVVTTWNNTFVCVSDLKGQVVAKSSAGMAGYKGAKRSTPTAAQSVGYFAGKGAVAKGLRIVNVNFKGPYRGRANALRGLTSAGIQVASLTDMTPLHTPGTRARKSRRL